MRRLINRQQTPNKYWRLCNVPSVGARESDEDFCQPVALLDAIKSSTDMMRYTERDWEMIHYEALVIPPPGAELEAWRTAVVASRRACQADMGEFAREIAVYAIALIHPQIPKARIYPLAKSAAAWAGLRRCRPPRTRRRRQHLLH